MYLSCLNHYFVYLLYFCPSLDKIRGKLKLTMQEVICETIIQNKFRVFREEEPHK